MDGVYYGSDVRVSLPQPPSGAVLSVPMFGFAFTENGLGHDITDAQHETLSRPTFAPQPPMSQVIWGDVDLDPEREFI
jgi:hypothetical protein